MSFLVNSVCHFAPSFDSHSFSCLSGWRGHSSDTGRQHDCIYYLSYLPSDSDRLLSCHRSQCITALATPETKPVRGMEKVSFFPFWIKNCYPALMKKKTLSATSIHVKPPATHACCVAAKPWLPPSLSSADTDWSCCPLNRWKQSINGSVMLRPEPLQQSSRLAGVNCAASDCLSEKFFNLQISTFIAYIKRCHICSRQVLLQRCKKKLVSTSPDAN